MAEYPSHAKILHWRAAANPFDTGCSEYDGWFESNPLFRIELAALRAVKTGLPHPFLEIGVGPGRFARELQVDFGIDPAVSPLQLARSRSIMGIRGIGEQLPVCSGCLGTVFILFTLCFLADPSLVLRECYRTLQQKGRLVIGLVPASSEWGKMIIRKKEENHPFYHAAHLRSIAEVKSMLAASGFSILESWSTLFQAPVDPPTIENPRPGHDEQAGFCVLVMTKKEASDDLTQPDHFDN